METYENVEISVLLKGTEKDEASKETRNIRRENAENRQNAEWEKPDGKSEFSDHVGTAQ